MLKHLQSLISQLNLQLSAQQYQQLMSFLELLQKWNQHYNLTALTTPTEIISHHFVDSLSITPFISGKKILDVGTGAGFPGIPLALYYPEKYFTLLDSRAKKTAFLQQAILELHIPNIEIVTTRVERYKAANFDVIMCRALGSITNIIKKTQHLIAPNGSWLFMKGQYPTIELGLLPYSYKVKQLFVPGLSSQRHLVIVSK